MYSNICEFLKWLLSSAKQKYTVCQFFASVSTICIIWYPPIRTLKFVKHLRLCQIKTFSLADSELWKMEKTEAKTWRTVACNNKGFIFDHFDFFRPIKIENIAFIQFTFDPINFFNPHYFLGRSFAVFLKSLINFKLFPV